jgi:pilus assembly protein CpaB
MKSAVVILTVLGILAAGSAALLVGAIRPARQAPTVRVLMAQSDLPAMTRLTADDVKVETVPREALPKGCFIDSSQVIGRALSTPLMKGQLLTESSLVARGAPAERMMALPPGMGVTTVTVPARSVNGGLLYPGCIVDVLATIPENPGSKTGVVSGTLFKAMQVWSLGDETGGPAPAQEEKARNQTFGNSSGTIKVSLLVNEQQTKILQSVAERGSFTLMIRNPREVAQAGPQTELVADEGLRRALRSPEPDPPPKPSPPPSQTVRVIRGSSVQEQVFPANEDGGKTVRDDGGP